MKMLVLLFAIVGCAPAFAGFQGFNGTQDLKLFTTLKCSGGLSCVKQKEKLAVSVGGPALALASGALTAEQCGQTIISGGVVEYDLPDASTVLGCEYTFIVGAASNLVIDPATGDTLLLLTNASGDSITADAIGESVKIKAIGADSWAPVGAEKGTWTDTN